MIISRKNVYGFLSAWIVYDWFIGSWIAANLQQGNWQQGINDLYQASFGGVILLTSIIFVLSRPDRKNAVIEMALVIFMMLFYVEDTAYYVLLEIVNPHGYVIFLGCIFPQEIHGWIGWITRVFGIEFYGFPIGVVFCFNVAGLFLAEAFLRIKGGRKKVS